MKTMLLPSVTVLAVAIILIIIWPRDLVDHRDPERIEPTAGILLAASVAIAYIVVVHVQGRRK